jgi:peptidoglycan/xylan/chitin deacetylase (PgdA/CDA1 family)
MRVRSLMYHDLTGPGVDAPSGFNDPWAESYKLPVDQFRQHLAAIDSRLSGQHINELQHISGANIPVLITFDDGGVSAMLAADILEERNWRGYFFVTTGMLGRPGFLDRNDLRVLSTRGHVVGSHSVNHPTRMSTLTVGALDSEWTDSVAALGDILGKTVTVASVPGGYYSEVVGASAARAGIRDLFCSEPVDTMTTTEMGCRIWGRYSIRRNTSPDEAAGLAAGDRWICARQRWGWEAKKILKRVTGPLYVRVGRMLRQ